MRKTYSVDWRAITCNEDEEQFATKAETERVVREHTADHEDVIALIYHNDRLKSCLLYTSRCV